MNRVPICDDGLASVGREHLEPESTGGGTALPVHADAGPQVEARNGAALASERVCESATQGVPGPSFSNCGRCHICGHPLRTVLDGEEWCDTCMAYRRYWSHGWGRSPYNDCSPCPPPVSYSPPIDRICPWCGAKHTGPFQACSSCKSALDRGE